MTKINVDEIVKNKTRIYHEQISQITSQSIDHVQKDEYDAAMKDIYNLVELAALIGAVSALETLTR